MSPRVFRLSAAVLALLGAGSVAVAGLVVADEDVADPSAPESVSEEGRPAAGAPAPRLTGVDPLTGEGITLAEFRGKPVVLTVWASWCDPCADGAAAFSRFAKNHREAAFVGIDYADTADGARAFHKEWGWEHPSIADPDGRLAARLGVTTMPTTFVLNRSLRIVVRLEGPQKARQLEAALRRAKRAA